MMNFGPLAAEIVALVWGTPANFNGFRILARVAWSAVGKTGHFGQLQVQLGSGKASKKLELYTTVEP